MSLISISNYTTRAFADARAFSPNLSHHGFWVAALRKKVTVTAVCAGDPIRVAQVGTNADRNSLLANVEMHGTWQFSGRCVGLQALLHEPYECHPLKEREQLFVTRILLVCHSAVLRSITSEAWEISPFSAPP
jgi:hypothetical protein